ncbi:type IV secretory system conjugative DNA transfer family protein [uncultured Roseobacter sp.]|uniref:type IV secretory system conjugative DNA transfer family protein n=1 Tax=uncultured Roseobacter sp. TaxID=114847 RepID=UPI002616EEF7|nr:type IV secretory system conjugative DNA transfer family protein [uncultured Roseobacter sp.]
MTRSLHHYALWGTQLAFLLAAGDAAAQGLFDFNTVNYRSWEEYHGWMAASRFVLIAGAVISGFVLGWFCSPQAKAFRLVLLSVIAVFAIGFAVFTDGALGWGLASTLAIIGFFCGLGFWLARVVARMAEVPTTFGSAKLASVDHLQSKNLFGRDGIILGKVYDGEDRQHDLSYKGNRHLFTLAPTGSGKGVGPIISNLLNYTGSVLVVDPKGENLMITGKAREAMGQRVIGIDPWDIAATKSGFKPARINPIDWCDLADPDAPENAMLLADALIEKSEKADPFWAEESQAILQGLILLVAFDMAYNGKRNLGTVRDLMLLTGDDQIALFERMANSPHALIASTGARCLQKDPKLLSNVMTTLQSQTHMLDSERVRDVLSASDFDFADLKNDQVSIYLILPADRLEAFSRLLRLLVQQAITVNARNIDVKPAKPALFILDEMPALGRLKMVEQAYGLMRGFGMQIWGIAQDLCQLRKVYGEDYETLIANSGAVAYFGSLDNRTTEYFSNACGQTTVWNVSSAIASAVSSSSGQSGGSTSQSITDTDTRAASQRKLIYPDELRRMDEDLQLVLIENADPIIAEKLRWYEDAELSPKGVNLHAKAEQTPMTEA